MKNVKQLARKIRARIIENSSVSKTPHLGSCLSCVDILCVIYSNHLNIEAKNPKSPDRDRFILSKGHGAPALFQVLGEFGFFPIEELETYGQDGSLFAEHPPTPSHLDGIEAATGSLGHGLPMGLGMAISGLITKNSFNVFVVLGDGECNEGSIWEAAMLASANNASNLCVLIDYNKWQATGQSNDILHLSPLAEKWKSFGWNTIEIDGNNHDEINQAIVEFKEETVLPTAIVAHTIKGKGVSFMEDDNNWHYRIPTSDEVKAAKKELGIQ